MDKDKLHELAVEQASASIGTNTKTKVIPWEELNPASLVEGTFFTPFTVDGKRYAKLEWQDHLPVDGESLITPENKTDSLTDASHEVNVQMFLYKFFTSDDDYEVEILFHNRKFSQQEFLGHYNYAINFLWTEKLGLEYLSECLVKHFGYQYPEIAVEVNNPHEQNRFLKPEECTEDLQGRLTCNIVSE